MSQNRSNPASTEPVRTAPGVPVLLLIALFVALPTLIGVGWHHQVQGSLNLLQAALSLYFSINLLICYWEICLFRKRDYIETRTEYWRQRQQKTGRLAVVEFFFSGVPLGRMFSPTLWADVWATYSLYDGSFADRRTFGFNIDISNGVVTIIPTLVLYAAFTTGLLPALVAGLIGLILFWQQAYGTIVYFVSFFVVKRHRQISRLDFLLFILPWNAVWVLFPALGIYVSVRLILDGNYGILGF